MTISGQISHTERRKQGGFAAESVGFSVAEYVSMGVSLLAVGAADSVAPDVVKGATRFVAKHIVEPYLDPIERGLKTVCRIKDCQPDEKKPRSERAESLARGLVLFVPAWGLSMAAKFWTRRRMNAVFNIKDPTIQKTGNWFKDEVAFKILHPNEWKIGLADEGIHYGSMIYLNTAGAEYSDDLIKATSKMLEGVGLSKQKAHDLANMAIVWELPNVLGWGAGLGVIYGKHKYGWGDQRRPRSFADRVTSEHPHNGLSHS
ncbi:MAG: hypothetical protein ACK502_09260 [Alphaproteobacteria bacterium]